MSDAATQLLPLRARPRTCLRRRRCRPWARRSRPRPATTTLTVGDPGRAGPPPIAGWLPGSRLHAGRAALLARPAGDLPREVRAGDARVRVPTSGDERLRLGGRARARRPRRERGGVGGAEAAQDRRALGHQLGRAEPDGRSASGARTTTGSARPAPNARPTTTPVADVADGQRDARERRDGERQHERREPEAEQHAVRGRGERQRAARGASARGPGGGSAARSGARSPRPARRRPRPARPTSSAASPPPSSAPSAASEPNVRTPPTSAPGTNAAHAASVVPRPPACRGPSVATIENPHGDHDPVRPATKPARTSAVVSISTGPSCRST